MRYFQRFAKEQEIAQILEDTADPDSGEINADIAQSLGMSGAQAAMLSLTKRMPHSVAPTPGLKILSVVTRSCTAVRARQHV